jgi:single-strand DNA-binding protein
MGINTFCVSGRLTRNPEMFVTQAGLSVLKFGLAHNERRKIEEEWTDVAHFFDCTIFGGYGEIFEHKLRKGDEITATGRLSWSQWQNDAGENRSKVELIVTQLVGEAVYRSRNGEQNHPQGEILGPDDIPQTARASAQTDDIPF